MAISFARFIGIPVSQLPRQNFHSCSCKLRGNRIKAAAAPDAEAKSVRSPFAEAPSPPRQIDVASLLAEVSGSDFVFEDDEEDEPVFEFERLAEPVKLEEVAHMPEVRGALDSSAADITSAYSVAQGFTEISPHGLQERLEAQAGSTSAQATTTTAEATIALSSSRLLVVDVRTAQEFGTGRVPGSRNISMDELSQAVRSGLLDAWKADGSQGLAVVCAGGSRSAQATVRLTKVFGFAKVASLKGGMAAWAAEGLPVEK